MAKRCYADDQSSSESCCEDHTVLCWAIGLATTTNNVCCAKTKRLQRDTTPSVSSNKPIDVVSKSEMMRYFNLLEDSYVKCFLLADACLLYSDKYLLAMVFIYFKRAKFHLRDYTKMNFFVALFLANDVEEDDEDFKYEILPWALSRDWRRKVPQFLQLRDRLLARMGYRAMVSRSVCEEVMNMEMFHWAWQRQRLPHHAGAMRSYIRGSEDVFELRGPEATPSGPCDLCAVALSDRQSSDVRRPIGDADICDQSGTEDSSWFLSSSSDDDDDIPTAVLTRGQICIRAARSINRKKFSSKSFKPRCSKRINSKQQLSAEL